MVNRFFMAMCAFSALIAVAAGAEDSEKLAVPLNGIQLINVAFKVDNFRITDTKVIKAEVISAQQIRVIGLAPGKSDLHITGPDMSKLYTITVNDDVRELFNSIRKDLDSVPELDISINRNKIVLKGEVSSLEGWDTIRKVLSQYGSEVLNLAIFRPAPEVMVALKKSFEKAGFVIIQDKGTAGSSPGELSLQQSDNTLILSGAVYSPGDIEKIRQILATQSWLTLDNKADSNRVKLIENLRVEPTMLDVGTVFVGIRSTEASAVGANLLGNGIQVGNMFNFSTAFKGGTSQFYNLNAGLSTILNLMAETGVRRFHQSGHLTFVSNQNNDFKSFHNGGTLKVRIYGAYGGTGALVDVPYGLIMKVRGGLTGAGLVKLDIELEMSTPVLMENNDYDLKQSKVSTSIVCKLGETVALSGMKDIVQDSAGPSGIPYLRKVPVLNWLCAENADRLDDSQVLVLVYPQVAGKTPELKMPPSAATADTLKESEKDNKQIVEEKEAKKSFWSRWF